MEFILFIHSVFPGSTLYKTVFPAINSIKWLNLPSWLVIYIPGCYFSDRGPRISRLGVHNRSSDSQLGIVQCHQHRWSYCTVGHEFGCLHSQSYRWQLSGDHTCTDDELRQKWKGRWDFNICWKQPAALSSLTLNLIYNRIAKAVLYISIKKLDTPGCNF